jgi:hypothetical protein
VSVLAAANADNSLMDYIHVLTTPPSHGQLRVSVLAAADALAVLLTRERFDQSSGHPGRAGCVFLTAGRQPTRPARPVSWPGVEV